MVIFLGDFFEIMTGEKNQCSKALKSPSPNVSDFFAECFSAQCFGEKYFLFGRRYYFIFLILFILRLFLLIFCLSDFIYFIFSAQKNV